MKKMKFMRKGDGIDVKRLRKNLTKFNGIFQDKSVNFTLILN